VFHNAATSTQEVKTGVALGGTACSHVSCWPPIAPAPLYECCAGTVSCNGSCAPGTAVVPRLARRVGEVYRPLWVLSPPPSIEMRITGKNRESCEGAQLWYDTFGPLLALRVPPAYSMPVAEQGSHQSHSSNGGAGSIALAYPGRPTPHAEDRGRSPDADVLLHQALTPVLDVIIGGIVGFMLWSCLRTPASFGGTSVTPHTVAGAILAGMLASCDLRGYTRPDRTTGSRR
jgi:hypothetical protein